MLKENLEILMISRSLNASDVARAAKTSRQAVSQWLNGKAGIHSKNIENISQSLGLKSFNWFEPSPLILDPKFKSTYEALLIWDRSYPSLTHFALALVQQQPRALGRLVETLGFYESERIVGKSIWSQFHRYKKYIPPQRRVSLEKLWETLKSQTLI